MKIKTPKGEICDLDECETYDDNFCEYKKNDPNTQSQKILAEELFKNTGILTGGEK